MEEEQRMYYSAYSTLRNETKRNEMVLCETVLCETVLWGRVKIVEFFGAEA